MLYKNTVKQKSYLNVICAYMPVTTGRVSKLISAFFKTIYIFITSNHFHLCTVCSFPLEPINIQWFYASKLKHISRKLIPQLVFLLTRIRLLVFTLLYTKSVPKVFMDR